MDNSLEKTKKRALRILGKRTYSEREMHNRLVLKGETPEDATQAVQWLVDLGYLNDDTYARLIVEHYTAKGYGHARIRDELSKRGIARDLQDEHMASIDSTKQQDTAVEFLRKKLRGRRLTDGEQQEYSDRDELYKVIQSLVRRGFSYDQAREAVRNYEQTLDSTDN